MSDVAVELTYKYPFTNENEIKSKKTKPKTKMKHHLPIDYETVTLTANIFVGEKSVTDGAPKCLGCISKIRLTFKMAKRGVKICR